MALRMSVGPQISVTLSWEDAVNMSLLLLFKRQQTLRGLGKIKMCGLPHAYQKAIPKATLIECGPDLVGISGIASIFKVSRQAIQKMVKTFSDTFPAPVHSGTTQIWHLIKILNWSNAHAQKHTFDETLLEIASAAREVNVYKEISELENPTPKNITRFFPKAERILELH